MQDEKYVNYYIETLTGTMTDCVVRNVSMQANLKVKDDIIKQQADKIGEFAQANEELFNEVEELKKKNSQSENEKVKDLNVELANKGNMLTQNQGVIRDLQNEIHTLNLIKMEYEKVKSQLGQIETFRSQLVKEREIHSQIQNELDLEKKSHETTKFNYEKHVEALSAQIETLQTPVKKKKVKKDLTSENDIESIITTETIKDGGEF